MTLAPARREILRRNDLEVCQNLPRSFPPLVDEIVTFPPQARVMEFLRRYRSVRAGGRVGGHSAAGGGPSPDFVSTANLTFMAARRLMDRWHPGRWNEEDPVEEWLKLRARESTAIHRAASHQFRMKCSSLSTRRSTRKETPAQAEGRRLWDRADKACDEAKHYEESRDFGLFLAFVGIVMVLWSVHQEPETFSRYVYG